ncbi:DHA2 family efflux MFS transporter permease subunit [Virgibacillus sp. CBA3643]|uniref:DHA2 family efflux MFS transporter permease subunit n=1 Tax=Virgibacillus sp. CBA3643 TaxID=2942278 RepID=UPI0035A29859
MNTIIEVKYPKSMAFVLMLGAFIGLFGETALNMALTNIIQEFSVSAATAQWLTTGYLLTLGIVIPITALLMRWFFTRQLIFAGLILSVLGSVLAALALNFPLLLTGRIVQAIGTGIIIPVMTTAILLIFPIHKRGMVMGIMGLVITMGPAIGPTLSGLIISTLGWPYIFWFSAIFYVLLIAFAAIAIANVGEITKPKIDILSIVLSTIGFGGIIYALSTMAELPLSSPVVWGPLLAGIIALILFGIRQFKLENPLVNLQVFKYPMYTLGIFMMCLGILVILSTAILLPLYLRSALLFPAIIAGLLLLPGNFVNFILSPIVGALFDKFGARKFIITGFTIVLIGDIIFLSVISATTPVWQIVVAFMVLFIGLTMVMMPSQTNALNQLPRELYADGSAAQNTLNQVAGAAGTAIAITVFTAGQNIFVSGAPNAVEPEIIAAGIKFAFYFITGITVIGLICSLFVKKPSKAE